MDGDPISVAVSIRDAEESDRRFLEHMFIEAVLWDPAVKRQSLDRLLLVPELRRYVIDWGRPGDLALIATVAQASVGASNPRSPAMASWMNQSQSSVSLFSPNGGADPSAQHCSKLFSGSLTRAAAQR